MTAWDAEATSANLAGLLWRDIPGIEERRREDWSNVSHLHLDSTLATLAKGEVYLSARWKN